MYPQNPACFPRKREEFMPPDHRSGDQPGTIAFDENRHRLVLTDMSSTQRELYRMRFEYGCRVHELSKKLIDPDTTRVDQEKINVLLPLLQALLRMTTTVLQASISTAARLPYDTRFAYVGDWCVAEVLDLATQTVDQAQQRVDSFYSGYLAATDLSDQWEH